MTAWRRPTGGQHGGSAGHRREYPSAASLAERATISPADGGSAVSAI